MDSVWQPRTVGALATTSKRCARLTAALGLEHRTLQTVLARAQHDLRTLRCLTLPDLLELGLCVTDAERVFYLVQWERLQAHLGCYGTLPEENLSALLDTLNPLFERHFARHVRLNDALIKLYRTEFLAPDEDLCLVLNRSPVRRFLHWLS